MNVIPISKASGFQHPDGVAKPGTGLSVPIASRALCHVRCDPGQTRQQALAPLDALNMIRKHLSTTRLSEVILNGSGDPLADIENTLETIGLIRNQFPDLPLVLSTSGINGSRYCNRLADAGLNRIELQVNAVREQTITRLYDWIRPGKKTIPLARAAAVLAKEQRHCITTCGEVGIDVSIRTTVYCGYNFDEVGTIAAKFAELGINHMVLQPCALPEDVDKEGPRRPNNQEINQARSLAEEHMQVVRIEAPPCCDGATATLATSHYPTPNGQRPNVAVASSNGMDIDTHLGHARKLMIFGPRRDGLTCFLETRSAPSPGGGRDRWIQLGKVLDDCFVLLTAGAGTKPRSILSDAGVRVLITQEGVEGTVDVLYGGGKKRKCSSNPAL